MITLSTTHAADRASAALAVTLVSLSAATISIYGTVRPATGGDSGGAALAVFTLGAVAGTIATGVLTLGIVEDALIMATGDAVWARISADGTILFDCDVSDTEGAATIRLATTQLYAGGSVRMTSGILG